MGSVASGARPLGKVRPRSATSPSRPVMWSATARLVGRRDTQPRSLRAARRPALQRRSLQSRHGCAKERRARHSVPRGTPSEVKRLPVAAPSPVAAVCGHDRLAVNRASVIATTRAPGPAPRRSSVSKRSWPATDGGARFRQPGWRRAAATSKRHRWTRHRWTPYVDDPAGEVLAEQADRRANRRLTRRQAPRRPGRVPPHQFPGLRGSAPVGTVKGDLVSQLLEIRSAPWRCT